MRRPIKEYAVDVLGYPWRLGAGLCGYTYYSGLSDHVPDLHDVARIAVDFSRVTDYRLSRSVPCPCCGHGRLAIVRDWDQPESADRWALSEA